MFWLALASLFARRVATGIALAGLLTATLGFVFLAGTSRTTQAVVTGDVGRAWQSPYQLLVRPPGSQTALEVSDGLVRPNFLAGLTKGGISDAHVASIRAITGVDAAAPIAIAGLTTTFRATIAIDLFPYLDPTQPAQLFEVGIDEIVADAGLSTYPGSPHYYILYSDAGHLDLSGLNTQPAVGPTIRVGSRSYACGPAYWCITGEMLRDPELARNSPNLGPDRVTVPIRLDVPMVFAGIDPVAEAQLVGLDRCVTDGRFLAESDIVTARDRDPADDNAPLVPVVPILVSQTTGLDETLLTSVQVATAVPDDLPDDADAWRTVVTDLTWQSTAHGSTRLDDAYRAALASLAVQYNIAGFRTPGDVTYRQLEPDHLVAEPVAQNLDAYGSTIPRSNPSGQLTVADLAPPEARDTWFRALIHHDFRNVAGNALNGWEPVGQFDPTCVAAFDPLTGLELQTYAPAVVTTTDGKSLGPSRNEAGYVNQAPLLLTTLDGARYFADLTRYEGRPGDAYISVVRIRVDNVEEPSAASEAKLARVAADIHDATGLAVDIVVGSSARPIQVDLAAGSFGRPAMTVTEGWAVKNVAVRFLDAVRAQDIGIFSLVLVVAAVLVAETAYLAVRRRRTEFGVLRALGWSPIQVGLLVEFEMLLLGIAAGVLAAGLGIPLARLLEVDTVNTQLFAAAPLSVVLAALAGLPPAIAAARGSTRSVMAGSAPRRLTEARSVVQLAIADLLDHRRREALLGIGGVALATTLLGGILLLVVGLAGVLDTTVLGTYLSGRVRPFHLVIGGLTLAVAAMTVAQVVTAAYLEREADFAALRALGWPRSALGTYLLSQAVALGLVGGLVGGLLTVGLGVAFRAPTAAGFIAALAVAAAAVALAAFAALGPLFYAYGSEPASRLRGE